jgi:ABC-type glycerol-3-phosphate transport system substrate-binding protein
VKRAFALVAAVAVLAGCSSSSGSDTQPLPVYKPNSNQNGEQTP